MDTENKPSAGLELGFLFHVIPAKRNTIARVLEVDAFASRMNELKSQRVTIDNTVLYNELTALLFPICYEIGSFESIAELKKEYTERYGADNYAVFWRDYKALKDVLKELCQNVFGDKTYWQADYENKYGDRFVQPAVRSVGDAVKENGDLACFLSDNNIPERVRNLICSDEEMLKALRDNTTVSSITDVFNAVKRVFYKSVRLGEKDNPKTKRIYFRRRDSIEVLCEQIYGAKEYWHTDYEQWIKENSI